MQLVTEIDQLSPAAAAMTLRGRLTLGSQLSLLQAQITRLLDSGVTRLSLDMAEVEYLDSAALGLLVHTNGDIRSRHGELRIAAPNDRVLALFKLTHTDSMLKIYPDRESSLADFDA